MGEKLKVLAVFMWFGMGFSGFASGFASGSYLGMAGIAGL